MGYSKTGSGPPPQVLSKPTLPSLADGEEQLPAFSVEDLADVQPGELDLLSTAVPDGLANPYGVVAGGWIVGSLAGDSYGDGAGPSGPLSPYAGANIDPNTNAPQGADANSYLGGPNADPYASAQSLQELWRGMGGNSPDTSQYLADNSGTVAPPGNQGANTANGQPISLGNGASMTVDSDGVAWITQADGQHYNMVPLPDGQGYFLDLNGASASKGAYYFNAIDIPPSPQQSPVTPTADSLTRSFRAGT
jgi:hypothetical protein